MPTPKLSIITINKNNREGLRRTIESVVSQTFQEFEYIVIDGASTDGSAELILEYPRINYSVSEPDTGIYNAMNKGIARATGEYLLFLNSGDSLYESSTINQLIIHIELKNSPVYIGFVYTDSGIATHSTSSFFESNAPHQACIYNRTLFNSFGLFNEIFTILGDWDFNLRISIDSRIVINKLNLIISVYEGNGMSSELTSNSYYTDIVQLYLNFKNKWKERSINPLLIRIGHLAYKKYGVTVLFNKPTMLTYNEWIYLLIKVSLKHISASIHK